MNEKEVFQKIDKVVSYNVPMATKRYASVSGLTSNQNYVAPANGVVSATPTVNNYVGSNYPSYSGNVVNPIATKYAPPNINTTVPVTTQPVSTPTGNIIDTGNNQYDVQVSTPVSTQPSSTPTSSIIGTGNDSYDIQTSTPITGDVLVSESVEKYAPPVVTPDEMVGVQEVTHIYAPPNVNTTVPVSTTVPEDMVVSTSTVTVYAPPNVNTTVPVSTTKPIFGPVEHNEVITMYAPPNINTTVPVSTTKPIIVTTPPVTTVTKYAPPNVNTTIPVSTSTPSVIVTTQPTITEPTKPIGDSIIHLNDQVTTPGIVTTPYVTGAPSIDPFHVDGPVTKYAPPNIKPTNPGVFNQPINPSTYDIVKPTDSGILNQPTSPSTYNIVKPTNPFTTKAPGIVVNPSTTVAPITSPNVTGSVYGNNNDWNKFGVSNSVQPSSVVLDNNGNSHTVNFGAASSVGGFVSTTAVPSKIRYNRTSDGRIIIGGNTYGNTYGYTTPNTTPVVNIGNSNTISFNRTSDGRISNVNVGSNRAF